MLACCPVNYLRSSWAKPLYSSLSLLRGKKPELFTSEIHETYLPDDSSMMVIRDV
jgi:hypothetical protein